MTILIKNGTIVSMNENHDIYAGDVLIEGDRIKEISSKITAPADQLIDAGNSLLIPGLVQSHVHLCQSLFRGCADDLELLDWLRLRIWPLEGSHDAESLYYSSLLGMAECLRGGTTSIIDMGTVHHTDSIFRAVKEAGIRYLGGKCMMNRGKGVPASLMETIDTSLQESMDLYNRWNGACGERINYALCPRFVISCTEDLLRAIAELAQKYNIPVHTHASENSGEIAEVEQLCGMRNIKYLYQLGLCNEKLILAHCIHLNQEEMHILSHTGANIAHCPSCNLKLASGIARIPELLDTGAHVSIGADGAPCNNNLDMFTEMRTAALIQKPFHGPTCMPAEKIFELATRGGARAMGLLNEIGSIEVGKKADIALVNLDGWHTLPLAAAGVYSQLVYQAKASDVICTIADGKIVMQEGRILTIDETDLKIKVEKCFTRVLKKAGIEL